MGCGAAAGSWLVCCVARRGRFGGGGFGFGPKPPRKPPPPKGPRAGGAGRPRYLAVPPTPPFPPTPPTRMVLMCSARAAPVPCSFSAPSSSSRVMNPLPSASKCCVGGVAGWRWGVGGVGVQVLRGGVWGLGLGCRGGLRLGPRGRRRAGVAATARWAPRGRGGGRWWRGLVSRPERAAAHHPPCRHPQASAFEAAARPSPHPPTPSPRRPRAGSPRLPACPGAWWRPGTPRSFWWGGGRLGWLGWVVGQRAG